MITKEDYHLIAHVVWGATHHLPAARNGFTEQQHRTGANGHPAYLAVREHLGPLVSGYEPPSPRETKALATMREAMKTRMDNMALSASSEKGKGGDPFELASYGK